MAFILEGKGSYLSKISRKLVIHYESLMVFFCPNSVEVLNVIDHIPKKMYNSQQLFKFIVAHSLKVSLYRIQWISSCGMYTFHCLL